VTSFETQQQLEAKRDAEDRQRQQEIAAALQQLQHAEGAPGPEAEGAPPMTAAQRAAIYGDSPNAPARTSEMSQAQAEAKQRQLAKEKQQQDAINSDTLAIDFEHSGGTTALAGAVPSATVEEVSQGTTSAVVAGNTVPTQPAGVQTKADGRNSALAPYDFDSYEGRLYRVFEGTVLEGVVTNHIDGGFSGPIMVDLTTDLYSHDHQQLLLPQGTRLLGDVQSVGNAQQRKMFVTFHRAICPDGFSIEFGKYIALDQIGTAGLATKIDHGYLQAFAVAAAIGGLGGLAQIGNNGSILSPSTEIRNGISEQSATEGEQVLNHFLDRLPVITLKEGSRARVYIGTDLLIPSNAEHRVNPTL
jgi:type IV secretion system protein VirB10